MDEVEVDHVRRYERDLRDHVRTRYSGVLADIRESGQIKDEERLIEAIKGFTETFLARDKVE